jgi:hypothetical protein
MKSRVVHMSANEGSSMDSHFVKFSSVNDRVHESELDRI